MLELTYYLFFAHFCVTISATNKFEQGWIPIPREEIYRRLQSNAQQPLNTRYETDGSRNTDRGLMSEEFGNEAIQFVNPQKLYSDFVVNTIKTNEDENHVVSAADYCEHKESSKCANSKNKEKENFGNPNFIVTTPSQTSTNERRAKMLNDRIIDVVPNSVPDEVKEKPQQVESDAWNSYEVTERTEDAADVFNKEPTTTKHSTYYDKELSVNSNAKNNLTVKFLDILKKYDIRLNSELTNYAKSRVPHDKSPASPQLVLVPLAVRYAGGVSTRWSAGPLLAVLLSRCLHSPRAFGLANNYRNLYGHLAYNNLHNNQPPAPYKIFSDTDSSNK